MVVSSLTYVMQCKLFKVSSENKVWSFYAKFILTFMKQNYRIISLPITYLFVSFTLQDLASGNIQFLQLYFDFSCISLFFFISVYPAVCMSVYFHHYYLRFWRFYQPTSQPECLQILGFLPASSGIRDSI